MAKNSLKAFTDPVYYSFDAGNVHYIVTPMPGGDHAPGYTADDVCRWLKNDLAHIRPRNSPLLFSIMIY